MQQEFEFSRIFVEIFRFLEKSSIDKEKFWSKIKELNSYKARYKHMSDKDIFSTLVSIIFFAGMRARTVEEKLPAILEKLGDPDIVSKYGEDDVQNLLLDKTIIRHKGKIRGCVNNAKMFRRIVERYGSFSNYLDSFGIDIEDFNSIQRKLIPSLRKFSYLGDVAVYHFLMDLGFGVMKPDRTICRLFHRLGWIKRVEDVEMVIDICRKISQETGYWIRVVDIILVSFCQEGGMPSLGINDGVCKNTPKCSLCPIDDLCKYLHYKYI